MEWVAALSACLEEKSRVLVKEDGCLDLRKNNESPSKLFPKDLSHQTRGWPLTRDTSRYLLFARSERRFGKQCGLSLDTIFYLT